MADEEIMKKIIDSDIEGVKTFIKENQEKINQKNSNGRTYFMVACYKGNSDIVNLLIEAGSDLNMTDKDSDTALHYAVVWQHYDVMTLILSQDSVQLDIKNRQNMTPLLLAVCKGHFGMMQELIAKGADINVVNSGGNNCLHFAVEREEFHSEMKDFHILNELCNKLEFSKEHRLKGVVVASYLAFSGASLYYENKKGVTPLDLIEDANLKAKLERLFPPQCVFCEYEIPTEKFLPCKHLWLCTNCCPKKIFRYCPECGQKITSKISLEGPKLKRKFQKYAEPAENPKFVAKGVQTLSVSVESCTFGEEEKKAKIKPAETLKLGEEHLHSVSKNLGNKWMQVGRELRIKQVDLDNIRCDFPHDTVEQGFQMLLRWFRNCDPTEQKLKILRDALRAIECFNALECLSKDVN